MRIFLSLAAGLLLVASSATAQDASRQVTAVAFMRGTCDKLDHDSTSLVGCRHVVINFRYSDGRESFTFTQDEAESSTAVSFSGPRTGDTVRADGATIRPIDMVVTGTNISDMASLHATGECVFADPEKGSAVIVCTAQTERGTFSGQFTTDGTAPDIVDMQ